LLGKLKVQPTVFIGSSILIWSFVLFSTVFNQTANNTFNSINSFITNNFSWWYIGLVAALLFSCLILMTSSFGNIKLGRDEDEPDFHLLSWLSMLFSAGMGIGLLFYGVAEPVLHTLQAPDSPGARFGEAGHALKVTFFHWGFHAWAIYICVGLSLAYFSFRKGYPLSIRYTLKPLLGDRVEGPIGHFIDILAVLGTLFGVATSLGLGVMQINSGLHHLFDWPISVKLQVGLIAFITLLATISVVTGVSKGIRILSEFNIIAALFLLVFVFIVSPTEKLLDLYMQNIGVYLQGLPNVTFHTAARKESEWMASWTLFYWGWWIAWAPFVGMFIARISKGRTIREFIIAVLFVPTLFTFLWFTVFGETALGLINSGSTHLAQAVQDNVSVALFVFLNELPWPLLSSILALIVVMTFFITSSDSGSFVIDMITSGGLHNPPTIQKIYWACMEGLIAAVLLIAGGLTALQTAAINAALPFSVVILLMLIAFIKSLREER
jgi:choline/glycine/proline betaine transport protein